MRERERERESERERERERESLFLVISKGLSNKYTSKYFFLLFPLNKILVFRLRK